MEIKKVLQVQYIILICCYFQNKYMQSLAISKHFLKSPGSFDTVICLSAICALLQEGALCTSLPARE